MKLAMLFCLLTANRDQVLPELGMKLDKNRCIFEINEIMKTTRSGCRHIPPAELIAYPHDKELCSVTMAECYLQRTKKIRGVFIKLLIYVMCILTSLLPHPPQHDGAERFLNRMASVKSALHIQLDLQQHPKHQLLECLYQKFEKLLDGLPQILLGSFIKGL